MFRYSFFFLAGGVGNRKPPCDLGKRDDERGGGVRNSKPFMGNVANACAQSSVFSPQTLAERRMHLQTSSKYLEETLLQQIRTRDFSQDMKAWHYLSGVDFFGNYATPMVSGKSTHGYNSSFFLRDSNMYIASLYNVLDMSRADAQHPPIPHISVHLREEPEGTVHEYHQVQGASVRYASRSDIISTVCSNTSRVLDPNDLVEAARYRASEAQVRVLPRQTSLDAAIRAVTQRKTAILQLIAKSDIGVSVSDGSTGVKQTERSPNTKTEGKSLNVSAKDKRCSVCSEDLIIAALERKRGEITRSTVFGHAKVAKKRKSSKRPIPIKILDALDHVTAVITHIKTNKGAVSKGKVLESSNCEGKEFGSVAKGKQRRLRVLQNVLSEIFAEIFGKSFSAQDVSPYLIPLTLELGKMRKGSENADFIEAIVDVGVQKIREAKEKVDTKRNNSNKKRLTKRETSSSIDPKILEKK